MHNNYKFRIYMNTMQVERVNFLKMEIENHPEDPFNYYALGLEFQKLDIEKAILYFNILQEKFPDYLGAYYSMANFYYVIGEIEHAKGLFERGIALAEKINSQKTLRELKGSYALFLDDIDD